MNSVKKFVIFDAHLTNRHQDRFRRYCFIHDIVLPSDITQERLKTYLLQIELGLWKNDEMKTGVSYSILSYLKKNTPERIRCLLKEKNYFYIFEYEDYKDPSNLGGGSIKLLNSLSYNSILIKFLKGLCSPEYSDMYQWINVGEVMID